MRKEFFFFAASADMRVAVAADISPNGLVVNVSRCGQFFSRNGGFLGAGAVAEHKPTILANVIFVVAVFGAGGRLGGNLGGLVPMRIHAVRTAA